MKTDYKKLEDQIDEIIVIVDDIIKDSQSVLENKNKPMIDRTYFSHIFNLFHFYWNVLFDTCETIRAISKRDEKERIKYLLSNLPGGDEGETDD